MSDDLEGFFTSITFYAIIPSADGMADRFLQNSYLELIPLCHKTSSIDRKYPCLTPRMGLGSLNRSRRCRIQILSRQSEQVIDKTLVLNVAAAIRVKHASIQHLCESLTAALVHILHTLSISLLGRLFGDGPVCFRGTSHPVDRVQHVLLADSKGLEIYDLVLEVFKTGLGVLVLNGETQNTSDGATDLGYPH